MFELMSAVTMVAGLQAAPEQIKIAQILERYEKVAMEPKALKVEFKRKELDPVDKSIIDSNGLFLLQRDDRGTSYLIEIHRVGRPDQYEKYVQIASELFELRPMTKQMRVHRLSTDQTKGFIDYLLESAFPL